MGRALPCTSEPPVRAWCSRQLHTRLGDHFIPNPYQQGPCSIHLSGPAGKASPAVRLYFTQVQLAGPTCSKPYVRCRPPLRDLHGPWRPCSCSARSLTHMRLECCSMSLLHRSRELLRYAGLDVSRFPNPAAAEARRVAILNANNVDLVLDVGASSGRYGLELRRHGYIGDILSFEPQPSPYERLAKRCSSD
jgi:hypothetical protein